MKFILRSAIVFASVIIFGCAEKDYLITISTDHGDMKAVLFDETPLHKESFVAFARSGQYDSTTFHRVLSGFMIQGGDVNAKPGITEQDNTLIQAEFRPNLIHTKGMIAGARQPDQVNPEKKSGTQFYIVHGRSFSREEIDQTLESGYYNMCVARLNQLFQQGKHKDILDELLELQKQNDIQGVQNKVYASIGVIEAEYGLIPKKQYTEEQYKAYEKVGGAPHLDFEYTVYGQVVDGLEVIDAIAAEPTNSADKPLRDTFMTVTVEQVSKKKIESEYGITYPEK